MSKPMGPCMWRVAHSRDTGRTWQVVSPVDLQIIGGVAGIERPESSNKTLIEELPYLKLRLLQICTQAEYLHNYPANVRCTSQVKLLVPFRIAVSKKTH